MEVIARKSTGRLQHIIEIGKHQLLTDVPTAFGGEDTGPAPHDFLAVALAGCTALTVTMYARLKKMDLQHIDVGVEHRQEEGAYVFNRRIRYVGNLSAIQKVQLTSVANRCPVHKILTGQVQILTEVS